MNGGILHFKAKGILLQAKSHTRITLGLDIIRKLTSGHWVGYHELGIVKHQIKLHDVISIEDSGATEIVCNHPDVPCDHRNICFRAVELVRSRFSIPETVCVTIEKRIPVMGGLAGGSANAATVLSMLNKYWELGLAASELMHLGRELGMDVPFYFCGSTAFDSESTGILTPVKTSLGFSFVIAVITPGVATAHAYRAIDYTMTGGKTALTASLIRALESGDRDSVVKSIHNDFEHSVFSSRPDIARVKDCFLRLGVRAAWMTGSGSTVVALVDNPVDAEPIARAMGGDESVAECFVSRSLDEGI